MGQMKDALTTLAECNADESPHYTAGTMLMELDQDVLAEGEWRRIIDVTSGAVLLQDAEDF